MCFLLPVYATKRAPFRAPFLRMFDIIFLTVDHSTLLL